MLIQDRYSCDLKCCASTGGGIMTYGKIKNWIAPDDASCPRGGPIVIARGTISSLDTEDSDAMLAMLSAITDRIAIPAPAVLKRASRSRKGGVL
jgi:hypothetical protein